MNTVETESVPSTPATLPSTNGPPTTAPEQRRQSVIGRIVLILLLGGAAGGALYAYSAGMDRVHRDIDRTINYVRRHAAGIDSRPETEREHASPSAGMNS